ncbi:uncharacterized protein JCM10292_003449 [Rhodotorula paludigena]|uniref:uncharacterized protein n=1 Tax=Rhodotorula paludigena TaxID=86838 RepID=UPI003176C19A
MLSHGLSSKRRLEPLYETLEARITKLETQFTKLEARVTKLEDEKVERQDLFKRPENAGLLAKKWKDAALHLAFERNPEKFDRLCRTFLMKHLSLSNIRPNEPDKLLTEPARIQAKLTRDYGNFASISPLKLRKLHRTVRLLSKLIGTPMIASALALANIFAGRESYRTDKKRRDSEAQPPPTQQEQLDISLELLVNEVIARRIMPSEGVSLITTLFELEGKTLSTQELDDILDRLQSVADEDGDDDDEAV